MKANLLKRTGAVGTAAVLAAMSAGCSSDSSSITTAPSQETESAAPGKTSAEVVLENPNVVYIMLDDTGYSDFGCYGSTINTPNLDALAQQGILYSDYYTQPMSSPSRASVLTGCESNLVGMGIISDVDFGSDIPNVNGLVYPEHGTLADTLKANDYSTIAVGKWHLGSMPEFTPDGDREHWPIGKGFDKSYCFLGSQANQWQPGGLVSGDEFVLADIDSSDYHFTTDMVDTSLRFIDDSGEQPFFLYFATGAMHGPFQAPKEYIDKYKGAYSEGWDVEREKRLARQIELGLLPEGTELPPMVPGVPAWDDLTPVQKQVAERHMEVYAGFLEHTDMEIGRLMNELKARDQYDNTIFVVMSDNGPNSNGMLEGSPNAHTNENLTAFTSEEQLDHLDNFGTVEYGTQYNKGWCMASATPFKYHKTCTYNGGLRVPCIVTWKNGITEPGRISHDVIDSMDITPTILDVLGIEQVMEVDGLSQHPMSGNSFAESFTSTEPMTDRDSEMLYMLQNNIAYTDGEYMIVTNPADGNICMYGMKTDPTQMHDLRESMPEKFEELYAGFENKKREYNSENLGMDILHKIDTEIMIERYGQLAADVLSCIESGITPEQVLKDRSLTDYEDVARWLTILRTYQMKVGASGYVGVATTWYDAPDSPHAARDFIYDPSDGYFFSDAAAPTMSVSHTVSATVECKEVPNGVIVANGGIDGGFVMYAKDGLLNFEYNFCNERLKLTSDIALPAGKTDVSYSYDKIDPFTGTGTLRINDQIVATGPMKQLPIFNSFDYFSIGADVGSKVSKDYEDDFDFNGTVSPVSIHLGEDLWEKNN